MEFFTSSIFCERERFGPEGRPYVCWLTGLALRPTKVDLGRPQVRPRSPDRSIFNGISNLKSLGFESHFILLATFTEVTNSKTKMTKSLRSSTASKLAVKRAQRQFPEWHFPKRRINHNIFFFFFFLGGGGECASSRKFISPKWGFSVLGYDWYGLHRFGGLAMLAISGILILTQSIFT